MCVWATCSYWRSGSWIIGIDIYMYVPENVWILYHIFYSRATFWSFSYTKKFDKYIYIYNIPRKFLFLFQSYLWSATLSKKKVKLTRNSFSATRKHSSRLVLRTNFATRRHILASSHTARSVRKQSSVSTTELLQNNLKFKNRKSPQQWRDFWYMWVC